MKIYKRMIRPMIVPPTLQGFYDKPYPLYSDDYWVDDNYEDVEKEIWEARTKDKDPMGTLYIEEKFVEIEKPKLEAKSIKPDDIVCLSFNANDIDFETACKFLQACEKIFPKETTFVMLPDYLSLNIFDKEEAYKFIETYKKRVDEKYNK